jgi:hypothetical protein
MTQKDGSTRPADVVLAFAKDARDRRAQLVAGLLREGWTGTQVSAGLKVIDAGGGVALAIEAMRAAL